MCVDRHQRLGRNGNSVLLSHPRHETSIAPWGTGDVVAGLDLSPSPGPCPVAMLCRVQHTVQQPVQFPPFGPVSTSYKLLVVNTAPKARLRFLSPWGGVPQVAYEYTAEPARNDDRCRTKARSIGNYNKTCKDVHAEGLFMV